jgi:hypothetical protein
MRNPPTVANAVDLECPDLWKRPPPTLFSKGVRLTPRARRDTMKTAAKLKATKMTKRPAPTRQPAFVAIDALLDEALDETFPASDPVALTQPSLRRRAALKKRAGRRRRRI